MPSICSSLFAGRSSSITGWLWPLQVFGGAGRNTLLASDCVTAKAEQVEAWTPPTEHKIESMPRMRSKSLGPRMAWNTCQNGWPSWRLFGRRTKRTRMPSQSGIVSNCMRSSTQSGASRSVSPAGSSALSFYACHALPMLCLYREKTEQWRVGAARSLAGNCSLYLCM